MMWPFKRRKKTVRSSPGDMRVVPVDNPMDWRDDGTIRSGDPSWGFFQEMMDSGQAGIANQRPDGTWETKFFDGPDDRR